MTKFDQMTNSSVVAAVNDKNLMLLDGRLDSKNKIAEIKSYATNPKMSTICTTGFGGIAVGSEKGEIRLYKQVGQNAKTLLPGFGESIISIDTTGDGMWLLATCKNYLLLIITTCKGDSNGFLKPMGQEKPKPIILRVKTVDIAKYNLNPVSFTPARFNVSKSNAETSIITSTGDYIVNWNFTKIRKGILDNYIIKKATQKVINNQFKYDKEEIVVTMPNNLRIQNQQFK